ncbi:MAG: hypothetical protein K0S35_1182 [Geminicoccaceae bacterium]|jgi:hypothetical protein|nr:hypothetical protein [Geminicoccaceae bacterium]
MSDGASAGIGATTVELPLSDAARERLKELAAPWRGCSPRRHQRRLLVVLLGMSVERLWPGCWRSPRT